MPLRYHRLWLIIGWGLILLIIVASLWPRPINVENIPNADKYSHLLAYGTLMGWFGQLYHTTRQRFGCLFGCLLLGVVLELLQGLTDVRHADVFDMLANTLGAVIAWWLTSGKPGQILNWFEQRFLP